MPIHVPYHNELTPTAGANLLNVDLREAAKTDPSPEAQLPVIALGQGAERARAPEGLFPDTLISFGPDYNPANAVGGNKETRSVIAEWAQSFLGIPADHTNTFLLQQDGREALEEMLIYARNLSPDSPNAGIPFYGWPMYVQELRKFQLSPVRYANPIDGNIDPKLRNMFLRRRLGIDITNSPHNPTGLIYPRRAMVQLRGLHEEVNGRKGRQHHIVHAIDAPYFYALKAAPPERGHFLEGGYDYVTKLSTVTNWGAIISFSKALGFARPGLTAFIVKPSMADTIRTNLTSGGGVSYDPKYFEMVVHGFQKDKYSTHLDHYARLRVNYETNCSFLNQTYGAEVVTGDAGMTALLRLKGLLGRRATWGGHTYELKETADAIEYFGNRCRVVMVDNGRMGNDALIRIAAAAPPDEYRQGILRVYEADQDVRLNTRQIRFRSHAASL